MSVDVRTFGCRLNAYESEVIRDHATQAGLDNTIVFNTCAVTKEAERQARQAIRKARRENPNAKIIVTGCSAQVHPELYQEMDEVQLVLGNDEKMYAEHYRFDSAEHAQVRVNDIMSVRETAAHMVSSFDGHTRAFIQVQNGCNHRCTFCIIPFGRGNSRSVPIGEVVSQVRHLVERGTKEIVLSGVDISSYGEDLPGNPSLGQLCRRMLAQVPELERLRLSSIDAVEVDDDLYRLLAEEPRLMPHLHISLQAGDDMILKRMKRRHLRQDALDFCDKVRDLRPDIVFGADIIAGFPTETDEMFENTLRLVDEAGLSYLHVFPYSEREGTPAAKMPQVPHEIRKERAAQLREKGKLQEEALYQSASGKVANVLVEKDGIGRSEQFIPVDCSGMQAGVIASVELGGWNGAAVEAKVAA
ncbi:MAG: tRNA (N(6)-L-threonylcarbamoyladenosine(37)-C(2))-methylthiotransferase MtaB [Rickettsiales bacterium]|nr:tRNA (N(6)-L-threonylcarbamoyladenosine(37)-C(2))-methylthiotransferase MtaB [Rickettsiales bacterium]